MTIREIIESDPKISFLKVSILHKNGKELAEEYLIGEGFAIPSPSWTSWVITNWIADSYFINEEYVPQYIIRAQRDEIRMFDLAEFIPDELLDLEVYGMNCGMGEMRFRWAKSWDGSWYRTCYHTFPLTCVVPGIWEGVPGELSREELRNVIEDKREFDRMNTSKDGYLNYPVAIFMGEVDKQNESA